MLVSSTDEFQAFMFEQLHFLPEVNGNYTCYSDREHPESGYCCIYCREGIITWGLRIIRFRRIFRFLFGILRDSFGLG